MTKPTLFLVRGIPGSGKSTFAKKLFVEGLVKYHFEADDYFTDGDGSYKFIPEVLGRAHTSCQNRVFIALNSGHSVVVANTMTKWREIWDYVKIANETDANVFIVEMESSWGSIHGVPPEKIQEMRDRFIGEDEVRRNYQEVLGREFCGVYLRSQ